MPMVSMMAYHLEIKKPGEFRERLTITLVIKNATATPTAKSNVYSTTTWPDFDRKDRIAVFSAKFENSLNVKPEPKQALAPAGL